MTLWIRPRMKTARPPTTDGHAVYCASCWSKWSSTFAALLVYTNSSSVYTTFNPSYVSFIAVPYRAWGLLSIFTVVWRFRLSGLALAPFLCALAAAAALAPVLLGQHWRRAAILLPRATHLTRMSVLWTVLADTAGIWYT